MSMFENPDNLRLLQKLLNPEQSRDVDDSGSDDGDDDAAKSLMRNNLNPANIGVAKTTAASNGQQPKADNSNTQAVVKKPTATTIEEWQAEQEKADMELLETRKCPVYKISYRQAVCTEDVFLQMGNRSSASASCEDLVIIIELPEESVGAEKMDLIITEMEVDLATPVYRLKLPLPQRVNVDRCRAEYESDVRRLCLKLRMQRELDFINF